MPEAAASASETVSRARYEREKEARLTAERLLEEKSRELYEMTLCLQKSLRKERELAALQADFITAVSHEFRTPLTIIDAAAHRLSRSVESLSNPDLEKKCQTIHGGIQKLTELIETCIRANPR